MNDSAIRINRSKGATRSYKVIAFIVSSALFMQYLSTTILTVALPTMAQHYGISPLAMSVVLTAYLLSLTVFIPASSALADRFGARKIFCFALALFTIASFLCAHAPDLMSLTVYRFAQGMGGAMMVPVARLILVRNVSKSELVSALAWMIVPGTIGSALGAPLGGLIVTYLPWHWVFYVNIPIGILGIIGAIAWIPEVRETTATRFDTVGFLLTAVWVSTLVCALELATYRAVTWLVSAALIAVSVVFFLIYLKHARRHEAPILDLGLTRIRTFGISVYAGSLLRTTAGALGFLVPMSMQLGLGLTPAIAGTVSFLGAAGAIAMRMVTPFLLRNWGFRNVLLWNGIVVSGAVAIYAAFSSSWSIWAIYLVVLIGGCLQSIQLLSYTSVAYAEVETSQMSSATSFYTMFQQLTLSLGVCIAVCTLEVARRISGGGEAAMQDYSAAFLVMAVILLFAIPFNLRLPLNAGDEIARYRSNRA